MMDFIQIGFFIVLFILVLITLLYHSFRPDQRTIKIPDNARIYLDTSAWARLFEQGNTTVNSESEAMWKVLRQRRQGQTIVSTTHQRYQLKAEKFRDAMMEYGRLCPNPPRPPNGYASLARTLQQEANLRDVEDAEHLVVACMSYVTHFITTDHELCYEKRDRIEKAVKSMFGRDILIANPRDVAVPNITA